MNHFNNFLFDDLLMVESPALMNPTLSTTPSAGTASVVRHTRMGVDAPCCMVYLDPRHTQSQSRTVIVPQFRRGRRDCRLQFQKA